SNPETHGADERRAIPNFAKRNQARMVRRLSIGVAAIAVLSVPAVLNFVGQGGSGDEVQISSEIFDGTKGATQKGGKKGGKKATTSAQSVSFSGAPSLELGALASELVGADQNFRSARDGFSFPNYSGKPTNDEIDATVMAALFGKEAVCVDKNAELCAMLPGAQAVANQLNEAMASGRCEGMSVLAQRFYDGYESRPNGASSTAQIAQDSVAKQIGYWWATQVAPSVSSNSKLYRAMAPTQITNELINGLRSRAGFTLGLYSSAGGHSVTPIAVTKDGNNFNIYVYDNNYPSEIRKVIVDSATQTWTYAAAALSSGASSSTWTGTGAGSMDLTSMASRSDRPFKVSLGGTKGVKGTSYSVIVTQKGNSTDPLGFKLTHRFGEVNSLDPNSVSKATFPVKSFLGAGGNQGAIAYIPTALSEASGMKLEIVGGKNTGKYTVSLMRTGATGAVVESNSKFDISVANNSFSTVLAVDLLNPSQKALVRLSNGNAGVDIGLVDGQSVEVSSPITDDDAFRGARRIDSSGPPFVISKWNGEEIASGKVEEQLSKGQAKIVKFAVDSQTGKVNRRFVDTTKSIIDEVFVQTLVPGKKYLSYDIVTKKPSAALIDVFDPIQLPTRAIAGPTTTTTTPISTTTTVAPGAPPSPPTTLAPESIVVRLSAQRYYGDTNSSIKGTDWGMTCDDSNSSATGCSFLTNAMKTAPMSDWLNMSLTLSQTAKVNSYSSETDGDDMSAELKAIAGWPSNYSAKIIVQLEVMPRPVTVFAVDKTIAFGEKVPPLTYKVVEDEDLELIGDLEVVGFPVNAGSYDISQGTLTNANNPNYLIKFTKGTLTITKIEQDVLAVTTSGVVFGSNVGLASEGGSGTGATSYVVADAGSAGCSLDGSTLSASGDAGSTCTVTVTKAESTNHKAKTSDPKTITVDKRSISVFAVNQTIVFGSSKSSLTYEVVEGTRPSLSGNLEIIGEHVNAGSYDISQGTLTNANNPNYLITFTKGTLTITAKPIIVVVTAPAQMVVGTPVTVSASKDGSDGALTWSASPANTCTISSEGVVTALKNGNCAVTANVSATFNYQAGSGTKIIEVLKANCGGGNGADSNTPGCEGGGRNEPTTTVAIATLEASTTTSTTTTVPETTTTTTTTTVPETTTTTTATTVPDTTTTTVPPTTVPQPATTTTTVAPTTTTTDPKGKPVK
ncbi:MAG: hypothetical protein RJB40_1436, partial [Actinomycetota bacterium]